MTIAEGTRVRLTTYHDCWSVCVAPKPLTMVTYSGFEDTMGYGKLCLVEDKDGMRHMVPTRLVEVDPLTPMELAHKLHTDLFGGHSMFVDGSCTDSNYRRLLDALGIEADKPWVPKK